MPELVLVTGSSGFIGRALVRRAQGEGARCIGIGRAAGDSKPGDPSAPATYRSIDHSHRSIEHGYRSIDLSQGPAELAALLAEERPSLIFHLAGGAPRGVDPFVVNVVPTRHLFEAVSRVANYSPRIIVIGSAAEYGNLGESPINEDSRERPVSEYGVAKLAQTRLALMARRRGMRVQVARPFNILGPGMSEELAPARFVRVARAAAASGERTIQTGDLTPLRDYLDVEQVADALWRLATSKSEEEIVNICSGRGISMGEILGEIQKQLQLSLEVRRDPKLVRGPFDIPVSIGDNTRLQTATGLRPQFDLPRAVALLLAAKA